LGRVQTALQRNLTPVQVAAAAFAHRRQHPAQRVPPPPPVEDASAGAIALPSAEAGVASERAPVSDADDDRRPSDAAARSRSPRQRPPVGALRGQDLRYPFGDRSWEEWSRADRVYMLRLFAVHAEATAVRLRQVVELTRGSRADLMEEMGWLPAEVAEMERPSDVEAHRLSTLAAGWRADADALQGPDGVGLEDGPSTADLREDDFLGTHFTDARGWVAIEGEQRRHRPRTVPTVGRPYSYSATTFGARNEESVP